MLAFPASAAGFIQTYFKYPYLFHGDIKLNKNIKQDLPPSLLTETHAFLTPSRKLGLI